MLTDVLIADDEVDFLDEVSLGLRLFGWSTTTCSSVSSVLENLSRRTDRLAALIVDRSFSDGDFLQIVRFFEGNPSIPKPNVIILVTGSIVYSLPKSVCCPVRTLFKPVSVLELDEIIRAHLPDHTAEEK